MESADMFYVATYNRTEEILEPAEGSSVVIQKVSNPTPDFTGYIYNVGTGKKTSHLFSLLKTSPTVYTEILPSEAYLSTASLGTGTKVLVKDINSDEIIETYHVVVFGDINGDGRISSSDSSAIRYEIFLLTHPDNNSLWSLDGDYHPLNPDLVPSCKLIAADLNKDGVITSSDEEGLKNLVLKLSRIDQSDGTVSVFSPSTAQANMSAPSQTLLCSSPDDEMLSGKYTAKENFTQLVIPEYENTGTEKPQFITLTELSSAEYDEQVILREESTDNNADNSASERTQKQLRKSFDKMISEMFRRIIMMVCQVITRIVNA